MGISNRAYTIIVFLIIVLLILLGIWVVKFTANLRIESKYYKYDNNLDTKIDVVVEQGGEGLNQLEANEIATNKLITNQIQTNNKSNTINKTNSSNII